MMIFKEMRTIIFAVVCTLILLSTNIRAQEKYPGILGLAEKDFVGDVNSSNERVIGFLAKHNIFKRLSWKTKKGTLMYRLGIQ